MVMVVVDVCGDNDDVGGDDDGGDNGDGWRCIGVW
jgi:hypothetical protein